MTPHHKAWLEGHPQYDEAWLNQALSAGMDVHHLDGNHDNNDPENLVLIEHSDHMKIHCLEKLRRLESGRSNEWSERRQSLGQRAYEMKSADPLGMTWAEVGEAIGVSQANNYARWWAESRKLPWPLVGTRSHEIVKLRKGK